MDALWILQVRPVLVMEMNVLIILSETSQEFRASNYCARLISYIILNIFLASLSQITCGKLEVPSGSILKYRYNDNKCMYTINFIKKIKFAGFNKVHPVKQLLTKANYTGIEEVFFPNQNNGTRKKGGNLWKRKKKIAGED